MNIKFYMSDNFACGHIRGEMVAREVNRRYRNVSMDCKTDVLLSDFYAANVMVFQRQEKAQILEKVKMAGQKFKIKRVYEVDDDMFSMPPEFDKVYQHYASKDIREIMQATMTECDCWTVSTHYLADALQWVCPGKPVFVVPNSIDCEYWERAYLERTARAQRNEVVIGWMASGSHKIDAPLVQSVLERLMKEHKNVRLHFIGWIGFDEIGLREYQDRITVMPWIDISELPAVMGNFDIGLAPLADCPFNRSKSGLKALQYWALGLPVVASEAPAYTGLVSGGRDGILCRTEDDWYQALDQLVRDDEARRKMGEAGRAKTIAEWDVRRRVQDWVNTYEMIKEM